MLYNDLKCTYKPNFSVQNGIANDRWYVAENGENGFKFLTAPVNRNYGKIAEDGSHILERNLLFLDVQEDKTDLLRTYTADYLEYGKTKIFLPYHRYGAVITSNNNLKFVSSVQNGIFHEKGKMPEWKYKENYAILQDGSYFIVIITEGKIEAIKNGLEIECNNNACKTVVSFYISEDKAVDIAKELFNNTSEVIKESEKFWEDYLYSCPISETDDNEFKMRQYWHWFAALTNVSNVEFNDFPIYVAPARPGGWLGTWSNDGPETMAVLSLTNQSEISRRLILSYVEAAINNDGIHSWYLHSDGEGCYGRQGDVGFFSHGVPCIVHTTDFYIRNTGDKSILNAPCGNVTLYEKLKKYMITLFELRDLDNDGLIEWRNLWETGWDDKLGCFFKGATLEDWCRMSMSDKREEQEGFYKENQYPVAAIVEQVYTLWALLSMKHMAELSGDAEMVDFCIEKYNKTKNCVDQKCWDEQSGFYYDYNVREECLAKTKSADTFYYLFFEKDKNRIERICEYITNPNCFGLKCLPMQSADAEGFSPTGYWSGGHWPREMSYVALGLHAAGKDDLARDIIIKALNSGSGNLFYEVMNPYTAVPTSVVTKMAYNSLIELALLCIENKIDWI